MQLRRSPIRRGSHSEQDERRVGENARREGEGRRKQQAGGGWSAHCATVRPLGWPINGARGAR